MRWYAHSPRKFHPSNHKSITGPLQLPFHQAPGCGRITPSLQSPNLTMKIGNQLLFPAEKEPCRGESIHPSPVTPVLSGMKVTGSVLKKLPGRCGASGESGRGPGPVRSGSDGAVSRIDHL